jgi:hypothetical protein
MAFLLEAAGMAGEVGGDANATPGSEIAQVLRWEEAVERLKSPREARTDLVITHWGRGRGGEHDGSPVSVAERLLFEMRHGDLLAPTIVFAWQDTVRDNRPRALALGARECLWRWEDLFREIARLFNDRV